MREAAQMARWITSVCAIFFFDRFYGQKPEEKQLYSNENTIFRSLDSRSSSPRFYSVASRPLSCLRVLVYRLRGIFQCKSEPASRQSKLLLSQPSLSSCLWPARICHPHWRIGLCARSDCIKSAQQDTAHSAHPL